MYAEYNIQDIDCLIVIQEGNVLEQEGVKIIHCPTQFETHPDVVLPDSVVGQFAMLCKNAGFDVAEAVERYGMKNEQHCVVNTRLPHQKRVFPRGQLCPIKINDNNIFCMAAFNDSDSTTNVEKMSLSQYLLYWENLWKNLELLTENKEVVSLAVPGGKYVSVDNALFTCEQKVGMIIYTFFRHLHRSGHLCNELRICLFGRDAKRFNYEGWKNSILPYLHQMSKLSMSWTPDLPTPIAQKKENRERNNTDAKEMFVMDLQEIIGNIHKNNGLLWSINTGRHKSEPFRVSLQPCFFENLLDRIKNTPELLSYFGKAKGNRYDRNRMLQLFWLFEKHDYLGKLNRISFLKMCLDCPKDDCNEVPERWHYLGTSFSNIVKYIGQQSSEIKQDKESLLFI